MPPQHAKPWPLAASNFYSLIMQGEIRKESNSGKVRLQDNKIFWDIADKDILQIDIPEICIIAEYTNSDGPWFDDWFIAFVDKKGHWQSIPMYADNIDNIIQFLTDKFDTEFKSNSLVNSTEWSSIIVYPTHLKGKTLFKLTPVDNYKEPKTFLDRILYSIGLGKFDTTKNIELTDEIKSELTRACR